MRGRNLYHIDDVLISGGGLVAVAVLVFAAWTALTGLAESPVPGREAMLRSLVREAGPLLFGAFGSIALLSSGFVMRRRERRIEAIWRLLGRHAELDVRDLLANSNFRPEELERAVRYLNDNGLGHYVWDRESDVIQDGRLRSLQLHVEKCEVCSAAVSLQVPLAFREIPECPYYGDPVSEEALEAQRRKALDGVRAEHRDGVWEAQAQVAIEEGRPFSMPVFVLLLLACWPAALVYALYKARGRFRIG